MAFRARNLVAIAAAVSCLMTGVASAQDKAGDKPADTMDLLRDKVRADKKLLVASALELTEDEAKGFWPVYAAYQSDMIVQYDKTAKLLGDYAAVYKTMTFFMQMVRKGEATLPIRQSASLLVAPFEGRGHALIDGQRFELEAFDTVAIPGGRWVEYINDGADPLILFVASDEPALAAFGLLTRYGRNAAGDVVDLR